MAHVVWLYWRLVGCGVRSSCDESDTQEAKRGGSALMNET